MTTQPPPPTPTTLPYANCPWVPTRKHATTHFRAGKKFSLKLRYDGQWHACHFPGCSFARQDAGNYTGRGHFQEWHGLQLGPGFVDRNDILAQARLVSEAEGRRLQSQWAKETKGVVPPYHDASRERNAQTAIRPGRAAIPVVPVVPHIPIDPALTSAVPSASAATPTTAPTTTAPATTALVTTATEDEAFDIPPDSFFAPSPTSAYQYVDELGIDADYEPFVANHRMS